MNKGGKIVLSFDKKGLEKDKVHEHKHKWKNANYLNVLLYEPG